ncbi:response regulator [Ekhidna sp.]
MNILIVEDNDINAKLLDIMLKDLGFESNVSIAEDAKTALEKSESEQFDLVLMDINLGDGLMDGTEVMKILKAKSEYAQVPIYAVTCYSLPGDKENFLDQGFDRYFSKPVAQKPLLEAINEDKTTNSLNE